MKLLIVLALALVVSVTATPVPPPAGPVLHAFDFVSCDDCEYNSAGVGFLPHKYCQAFIRCEKNPYAENGYIAHEMCCRENMVWDQKRLTCVRGPSTTNCLEGTGEVVCPNNATTTGPCPYIRDENNFGHYIVMDGAIEISMPCAPTTVFDNDKCTCVAYMAAEICERPIHFDFNSDYDSRSCNNFVKGVRHSYPYLENGALYLDGVDDFVEFSFFNNWFIDNPKATTFTLAAWIKPMSDKGLAGVISNGDCHQPISYGIGIWGREVVSGIVQFDADTNVFNVGALQPTSDEANMFSAYGDWHHVASVYDGTSIKLYLDATLLRSLPMQGSIFNSQSSSSIGMAHIFPAPDYFHGYIDDVKIYTIALTDLEVVDCMNGDM